MSTGSPRNAAPRFLALVGPTASGKTRLSLALAGRLDAEVVSVDSRQVYRGMDVGTAKVTPAERASVPHHGLDLVDPDESYSAGRFARDARRWIREIRGRDRLPLLAGGTGFFLKSVMEPLFREPSMDPERVEGLRDHFEAYGAGELEAWVRTLDPGRAEVAVEGGPQRMIRTLEVALLTGRPLSWWHDEAGPEGPAVPGRIVRLTLPRDVLDERIRRRTRRMVRDGLVEEVRRLLDAGYSSDDPGMSGTGYREIAEHLRGERTLEEAVERIEIRTRQYSRRQLTWFRNQLPDHTLSLDATTPLDRQVERVVAWWREQSSGTGDATA